MRKVAFVTWYITLAIVLISLGYSFFLAFTADHVKGPYVIVVGLLAALTGAGTIASYAFMDKWLDEEYPKVIQPIVPRT
jgi:hypothetical protein